jgi:hypothetical protein
MTQAICFVQFIGPSFFAPLLKVRRECFGAGQLTTTFFTLPELDHEYKFSASAVPDALM